MFARVHTLQTTPEQLQLFAQSLGSDDRVALEVTGSAWEIARILEPRVARVVVVSPNDTGIRQARAGYEADISRAKDRDLQDRSLIFIEKATRSLPKGGAMVKRRTPPP